MYQLRRIERQAWQAEPNELRPEVYQSGGGRQPEGGFHWSAAFLNFFLEACELTSIFAAGSGTQVVVGLGRARPSSLEPWPVEGRQMEDEERPRLLGPLPRLHCTL